jgi:hypothetical protein
MRFPGPTQEWMPMVLTLRDTTSGATGGKPCTRLYSTMTRPSHSRKDTSRLGTFLGVASDKLGSRALARIRTIERSTATRRLVRFMAMISMPRVRTMNEHRWWDLRVKHAVVEVDGPIVRACDRWSTCNSGIAAVSLDMARVF